MKVLEPLSIVIDVAGVYDHSLLRYDHHQRGFFGELEEPALAIPSRAASCYRAPSGHAPRAATRARSSRDAHLYPSPRVRARAETFDGEVGVATGPESATGRFKPKLSASGLVYKHYGREILTALEPSLSGAPAELEWVYVKLYKDFMEGIDANDNGIEIAEEVRG